MGFISAVNGYVEEIPWKEFVGISIVNFFFIAGTGTESPFLVIPWRRQLLMWTVLVNCKVVPVAHGRCLRPHSPWRKVLVCCSALLFASFCRCCSGVWHCAMLLSYRNKQSFPVHVEKHKLKSIVPFI
jgi:hypothetical protein